MEALALDQVVYVIIPVPAERHRLTGLLRAQGLEVQAFGSAAEFLDAVRPEARGCLVCDLSLPDHDGIALMRELATLGFTLPVLIIDGREAVRTAVRAVQAGATDFISRPYSAGQLLRSIDACLEKDREKARTAAEHLEIRRRLRTLSPREKEILALVAAGNSSKAIARSLGISPRTVETYRATAKAKMQAANTSDLVRMSLVAVAQIRGFGQGEEAAAEDEESEPAVRQAS